MKMEKCVTVIDWKQLTKEPNNMIPRKSQELAKKGIWLRK